MLLDVITGALEPLGTHPRRRRLHVPRQLRLRHRPGVLVRAEPRRHRRVAAQARLARRDGRRVGAVRGVAAPARGRHRRSRSSPGRAARRPATRRSSTRWRWTRTSSRPLGADPVTFAALQARALIAAGITASGRWPRSRVPQRAGTATSTSTRCSPRTTCARRCAATTSRPITDGAARWSSRAATGPASCATARRGSPASTTGPSSTTPAFRDLAESPSTRLAAKAAGLDDGTGRGGRAPGDVHPRGAAAASRRSASAPT